MNTDLLEALSALATACYFEARRCHPSVFRTGDAKSHGANDEEHAVLMLVSSLDDLIARLNGLLSAQGQAVADVEAWTDLDDDDIPF